MGKIIKVANKSDVKSGQGLCVSAEGKDIALFCVNGSYHAIDNTCTHSGGPLAEGPVDGKEVVCPWHGAAFDVTTGAVLAGPATESVNCYKVHLEGEDVKLELP